MSDEDDFRKYRPDINEMTIVRAAQSFGEGNEILSLNGRRTAIDSFVLMLATDAEVLGPFLMNATCARALCGLLQDAGLSPQKT